MGNGKETFALLREKAKGQKNLSSPSPLLPLLPQPPLLKYSQEREESKKYQSPKISNCSTGVSSAAIFDAGDFF